MKKREGEFNAATTMRSLAGRSAYNGEKPRGSLGVQWGEGGGRFDSREFVKFVGFVVLRRGGSVTMRRSEEAGVAEVIEGGGEAFAFSALEVGGVFEEQRFAAVG